MIGEGLTISGGKPFVQKSDELQTLSVTAPPPPTLVADN